uniref:Thioredoxin domain-containing protein n=1 Tax=Spongospora subterranea TaxID=70186 RepID=A0A0H5QX44_9EUKA|eukprot:CRZ06563.1 hypothetical protein [Spongospora subterranea]
MSTTAVHTILCPDPQYYHESLDQARAFSQAHGSDLFILVFGQRDPTSGKSWCPDCDQAFPIIMEALERHTNPVCLLELVVARESYKGNPSHPYRIDPQLQLKAIPQLHRIDTGHWKDPLIELCYANHRSIYSGTASTTNWC